MHTAIRIAALVGILLPWSAHSATISYTCRFPTEASPKGLANQAQPFELRFVVDTGAKKSYLLGNAGSSEVELIPNTDGVSFVEITASGNVMVTAITAAGAAVHSRNGIMFKELIPSQYYGTCTRQ